MISTLKIGNCFGRRLLLSTLAVLLPVALALAPARAQSDYPSRPIHVIVGFAAGGGNDIFARLVGAKLSELIGQPVVIENKPAAGGRLAAEYVSNQTPDGYILLVGASGAMSIAAAIYPDLKYYPTRDSHTACHDRKLPADYGDCGESSGKDRKGNGRMGEAASRQGELPQHVAGFHHRHGALETGVRDARSDDPLQEQQRDDSQRYRAARP